MGCHNLCFQSHLGAFAAGIAAFLLLQSVRFHKLYQETSLALNKRLPKGGLVICGLVQWHSAMMHLDREKRLCPLIVTDVISLSLQGSCGKAFWIIAG